MRINKEKNKIKKVLIVLFVFLFLVFFFNFFQLKIKNLFYLISSPLQKKLWKSGGTISNFFASFLKIKKVEKEINSLKKENAALTAQIARLRNLEEENIFLRKALIFF